MKKWLLIGMVILIPFSGILAGCGSTDTGVAGKYVSAADTSRYLELYRDGTYRLESVGPASTGEWELQDDTVVMKVAGATVKLKVEGEKLIDSVGRVWIKEDKRVKEETMTPAVIPTPEPTPTPKLTPEIAPTTINEEDIEWLATVIASEAGSIHDKGSWVRCTDEERAAVGWTVINRLNAGTYGKSIRNIVTAQAQYAHNQEPNAEVKELARKLLAGTIEDTTGGATHFFSPISMPKEGEPTAGFDTGGGIHNVSGIGSKIYFPSWTDTMTYVGDLKNVRKSYFMFYRSETPITTASTPSESKKIVEITDLDLVNLAIEAHTPNMGESNYYYKDLSGISFGQVIKVSGKITFMQYNKRPGGDTFYIGFRQGEDGGDIEFKFGNIATIRAKELILKGLINEGDEVIIQGVYRGYELRRSSNTESLRLQLSECSFVDE